jgi:hypothetical protein
MDYQNFMDQVKDNILDYLPEKFSDADVSVKPIMHNNGLVKDGLIIRTEESNAAPTIYLNSFYDKYQYGEEMSDIMNEISALYTDNYLDKPINLDMIGSYESVKDRIVCKLINKEDNEKYLADKPYTQVEDLAAIYQLHIGDFDNGEAAITINDSMMEKFGVTLEDIHDEAVYNTEKLKPHTFDTMENVVCEIMTKQLVEEMGMDEEAARDYARHMVPEGGNPLHVLTNSTQLNGAAALLNQETLDEITEKLGGDFFVLPSSVHEVLILPKSEGMEYHELENIVQNVNLEEVKQEDRLSDHVYQYDSVNKELIRCDRAEEREKAKAAAREDGRSDKKRAEKARPSLKERLSQKKDVVKSTAGKDQPTQHKKKEASL